MSKKILCCILTFVFLLSIQCSQVSAQKETNRNDNTITEESKIEFTNKFKVDLTNCVPYEKTEKEITFANGNKGKVIIEYIPDETLSFYNSWDVWHTRKGIKDGTYKINVVVGCAAGFTIRVKNYNITEAYGAWYTGPFLSNMTLKKNSSKQATLTMRFGFDVKLWNSRWEGGVRSSIEGKNLVTYWY